MSELPARKPMRRFTFGLKFLLLIPVIVGAAIYFLRTDYDAMLVENRVVEKLSKQEGAEVIRSAVPERNKPTVAADLLDKARGNPKRVTQLELKGKTSLRELEGFEHLKSLKIELGEISFESLPELKSLESIDLWLGTVHNLSALARQTNLRSISLDTCKLKFLDASGVPSLERLRLYNDMRRQGSLKIKDFPNLEYLEVAEYNRLEEIELVGEFNNLTSVRFMTNPALKVLKGLDQAKNLTEFWLTNNDELPNLDSLTGLANLEKLLINNCDKLESIEGLSASKGIKRLDLAYCGAVASLDGLQSTEALEELCLISCKSLKNLDPIMNLENLRWVNIYFCTGLDPASVERFRKKHPGVLATRLEIYPNLKPLDSQQ